MDEATIQQLRAELAEHTMYDLLGGADGLHRIVDRFYDAMDDDPLYAPIRSMHQTDLGPIKQGLFEFLSGWLGGPPLFVQRTGGVCITGAHAPYAIDARARDLWVRCIDGAMADAGVADRYREALMPAFTGMAEMLRNVD
ncbi:MAG: group II truncated hemoglobin [Acidimicrobiales bacterium]